MKLSQVVRYIDRKKTVKATVYIHRVPKK